MTLKAEACYFRGADNALLYFDVLETGPTVRGVIVTLHGLGEHSAKYAEWLDIAVSHGYHVMAYDQRGHGRTAGRRGDFRFDDLVDDLDRFIAVAADRYRGQPVFVVAHSLGALVTLACAGRGAMHEAVHGLVLTSPPLALADPGPRWFRVAVQVLSRIAPGVPIPRGTRPEKLTRDPERRAAFASDRLWHRVMTPRAMLSVAQAMESVRSRPQAIQTPALFLIAGADAVVSSPDAIGYAHAISGSDTTIEQIPGAYHEILNDLGRRAIFDRILRWCDER